MHGKPRPKPGPEDPAVAQKKRDKAQKYGRLSAAVLGFRAAQRYDAEALAASAKLLELNPEVYTVWNYRREALAPVLQNPSSEAAREAVQAELLLTQKGLAVNPKSYATWHHRGWIVQKGGADLQNELALVKRLLQLDDRNFHGWAYWRWLVARAQTSPEECLEFTMEKLRANFSNYSAWHARTALLAAAHAPPAVPTLQQLLAGSGAGLPEPKRVPMEVLDVEFDLVHKAFWTEPGDQSAWLYHRWLLGSCLATADGSGGGGAEPSGQPEDAAAAADSGGRASQPDAQAGAALHRRLSAEAAMCEELLQVEPDAKWPLLTLTRAREALAALEQPASGGPETCSSAEAAGEGASHQQPAGGAAAGSEGAYQQLTDLDPLRSGYYADAVAGRAHVVLRPPSAASA